MDPLRIALVNVPFRLSSDPSQWITVPPQGYGGIQWVVATIMNGLLELGHEVFLLGAPNSPVTHPRLTVLPLAEKEEVRRWLRHAPVDVVHDHSDGLVDPAELPGHVALVSTHHLTSRPNHPVNCVYLSQAQREHCGGGPNAPVVPIPVDPAHCRVSPDKEDFLLFLGRVSPHKGAFEAAAFARAAGVRLLMAGPAWEQDYADRIMREHGTNTEMIGEVGGTHRRDLLATARAVLVLSQATIGPWGGIWCEPGATVVSEAAASGTPVVATRNGCLTEIVPPVGTFVPYGSRFGRGEALRSLEGLPTPETVRAEALKRWGHVDTARRYEEIFRSRLDGLTWK